MLKPKTRFVEFRINEIMEFYEKCIKTVDDDLIEIETKNENGYYDDFGDYEYAYSIPLVRKNIIDYATINELNILVEDIFRMFAYKNFIIEKKKKRNVENNILENLESQYDIYTINFDNLKEHIKKGYNINISHLEGYNKIIHIRNLINAYKHRNEHKYKNLRSIPRNSTNIFEKYCIHDEDIMGLINDIKNYLFKLFDLTINGKNIF